MIQLTLDGFEHGVDVGRRFLLLRHDFPDHLLALVFAQITAGKFLPISERIQHRALDVLQMMGSAADDGGGTHRWLVALLLLLLLI